MEKPKSGISGQRLRYVNNKKGTDKGKGKKMTVFMDKGRIHSATTVYLIGLKWFSDLFIANYLTIHIHNCRLEGHSTDIIALYSS